MNTPKWMPSFGLTIVVLVTWGTANAQPHGAHGSHGQSPTASEAVAVAQAETDELAEGEIRIIDASTGRVTIRHGVIKSMDMPPMTMVFQLRVPSPAPALKPGDKVRFRAEQDSGGFVVTVLEVQG